jgi:hypothetical protein
MNLQMLFVVGAEIGMIVISVTSLAKNLLRCSQYCIVSWTEHSGNILQHSAARGKPLAMQGSLLPGAERRSGHECPVLPL